MSRYAYVNGQYLPLSVAGVHVEDRGYQFADGVYEVVAVANGHAIDEEAHLARLDYSLKEMSLAWPVSKAALKHILKRMVALNRLTNGLLYLQITRGVSRRDHGFPKPGVPPALVVTAKNMKPVSPELLEKGVAVVTMPDLRWKRCDIKSVSLLPNILAKQAAKDMGAYEAWLLDDKGYVTEGSSTNAWIVTDKGEIVTRPLGAPILAGVTRRAILALAKEAGLKPVERPFKPAEALKAKEAFLTSATSWALPITRIDGKPVGDGKPGPMTLRLRALYAQAVEKGL
ncbi:MAG: D-amino-acid transaminase [Rhodospirillales bacterium]|jgi:D-alanine transaminase|nr:D-amino-acid transaminase [Rhodospirillales bacterium]